MYPVLCLQTFVACLRNRVPANHTSPVSTMTPIAGSVPSLYTAVVMAMPIDLKHLKNVSQPVKGELLSQLLVHPPKLPPQMNLSLDLVRTPHYITCKLTHICTGRS